MNARATTQEDRDFERLVQIETWKLIRAGMDEDEARTEAVRRLLEV